MNADGNRRLAFISGSHIGVKTMDKKVQLDLFSDFNGLPD